MLFNEWQKAVFFMVEETMNKLLILLLIVFLASCASPRPQVFKSGSIAAEPVNEVTGVNYLIEEIDIAIQQNNFARAAEIVQRGLRITPDNAVLWQRFAVVEFEQGNYAQAEQNALRSIRFSPKDDELMGMNNNIIAAARELLE